MADYLTSQDGNVTILEISGRIEPDNWQELHHEFQTITDVEGMKHLVVDLKNLEYTASAGFRELFMVGKKLARQGGKLAVCSLQGDVRRIFDLAGFETAYPIFHDRPTAVSHIRDAA